MYLMNLRAINIIHSGTLRNTSCIRNNTLILEPHFSKEIQISYRSGTDISYYLAVKQTLLHDFVLLLSLSFEVDIQILFKESTY